MASPQVYEGTAEEIAAQLQMSKTTGRLRAIVVPDNGTETNGAHELETTLAERLQGRVGRFDFGDANLSEETGKKFTDLLVAQHQKGQ